jgi:hypothetical protein
MVRHVHTHVTVEGMSRVGFGFVGPTCKSRAGLRPSPPDQVGLPGQDLQSESTWRLIPAEVARNNVFGSPDRGNRSQTALSSDRLGCRDGYPVREVTLGGYQISVTRLSQDESADKYVRFHCSHRGHPLHSTDHSLRRRQRTRSGGIRVWRARYVGPGVGPPERRLLRVHRMLERA